MISLPTSNKPQPGGSAANVAQANASADSLAMDAQPVGTFALMLARQIGEVDLSALTAAQAAIDGNSVTAGADAQQQDQTAIAANFAGDPTNPLAAILQQLPMIENSVPKTDSGQTTQPFSISSLQDAAYKKPTASAEGSQLLQLQALSSLSSEAAGPAELPSVLSQAGTMTTAQAIASSAISAAIPGALTGNMPPVAASQTVATPLGNNGWADEFSQKISWISTQQYQVAELHLNPPNLGPLDVVMKISGNEATVLFTSPHGAVREAVENALPKLRETLADNGIMLGNATISDQPPRDRSMDGSTNQGSGAAAQRDIFGAVSGTDGLQPQDAQAVPARRHNGMVDTFA